MNLPFVSKGLPAGLPVSIMRGPLRPLVGPKPDPGLYVIKGPQVLPGWALTAILPALMDGQEFFWIDAGNSFAAYGLSKTAKALGANPNQILSRIKLARPFTAYQLEAMVNQKLPTALNGQPVVISDPLALFCDPDLSPPKDQSVKVFRRFLDGILRIPSLFLVLMVDKKQGLQFEEPLLKEAKAVATLELKDGFLRLAPRVLSGRT